MPTDAELDLTSWPDEKLAENAGDGQVLWDAKSQECRCRLHLMMEEEAHQREAEESAKREAKEWQKREKEARVKELTQKVVPWIGLVTPEAVDHRGGSWGPGSHPLTVTLVENLQAPVSNGKSEEAVGGDGEVKVEKASGVAASRKLPDRPAIKVDENLKDELEEVLELGDCQGTELLGL
ncbi:uncharacterized protein EI90DRAFT_3118845 [Cantharellus anzutake]|uniref:uncharacterized protein n=1 Tax=Cantharellus anzutake TaxID=1750568 RepID=UPI0019072BA9|nr:uncharacterized protein EI90DRAFT_3118845 [Cantharellus anzutake]KAF8337399.1 hypothetical protein EI90DRAFT_3118845 [Cantharellus anzutake]